MKHQVLPESYAKDRHPIGRVKIFAAILFIIFFALFALFVLLSRMSPSFLTGKVTNMGVATSVNITSSPFFICNTTLSQGTVLMSFPCFPLIIERDELFTNLSGGGANVLAMYRYTPTSSGKWQVYNGSLPGYVIQSLAEVSRIDGIYFVMDNPETLYFQGVVPLNTSITMRAGWNLVGYPSNTTRPLSTGLSSILDTYLAVKTLEGSEENGSYIVNYSTGAGDLTNLSIYHGYWINLSANDVWVVPR